MLRRGVGHTDAPGGVLVDDPLRHRVEEGAVVLFGLRALGDVGAEADPLADACVVLTHGHPTCKNVSVDAVATTKAKLGFKEQTRRDRALPGG